MRKEEWKRKNELTSFLFLISDSHLSNGSLLGNGSRFKLRAAELFSGFTNCQNQLHGISSQFSEYHSLPFVSSGIGVMVSSCNY